MAVNELEFKKREITRNVSKAYFLVLYLQNKQGLYHQIDSIYQKYSGAAEMSFEQGEISYLEKLNAQSIHNRIRLNMNQLGHDIEIALNRLTTLMNYDTLFMVPKDTLPLLVATPDSVTAVPEFQYLQNEALKQNAELKVEKNMLLPDLTLSYFNGTNRYTGARHYQGFEVGLGIPLFFSEQRARIKAKSYQMEATASLQQHYIRRYNQRVSELATSLKKYGEEIQFYLENGKQLAAELSRSAQISFQAGEIDFYRFVLSLDQAVQIELNHLEALHMYNETVLDINYLTIE
jgi:cobalt-zinc-cadmium resistance protein CzcA